MDADTPRAPDGAAVDDQGVRIDADSSDDPNPAARRPRAPSEESPQS